MSEFCLIITEAQYANRPNPIYSTVENRNLIREQYPHGNSSKAFIWSHPLKITHLATLSFIAYLCLQPRVFFRQHGIVCLGSHCSRLHGERDVFAERVGTKSSKVPSEQVLAKSFSHGFGHGWELLWSVKASCMGGV